MSDLVGNPEDRFSRIAAQFVFKIIITENPRSMPGNVLIMTFSCHLETISGYNA